MQNTSTTKPFPSTDRERQSLCALWTLLVFDIFVFGSCAYSPSIDSWYVVILLCVALSIIMTATVVFVCCNCSCLGCIRSSVFWWVHFCLQLAKIVVSVVAIFSVFWLILLVDALLPSDDTAKTIAEIPLFFLWYIALVLVVAFFVYCFAAYKTAMLATHYSQKATKDFFSGDIEAPSAHAVQTHTVNAQPASVAYSHEAGPGVTSGAVKAQEPGRLVQESPVFAAPPAESRVVDGIQSVAAEAHLEEEAPLPHKVPTFKVAGPQWSGDQVFLCHNV
uniref:Uncharacterized protein n=1 Tax=Chromera velia CCMP2878 TaxID=1169474 RepID=A0A0G4GBK3_9ALVE|eukprot:Cvel_21113.t1-p1 / transcript=Cvel_21113.t1 / gene=Cvel_21113 / organism=Chromera_velia_CCMP2878 / gene_product=hypothetical protein / transcript_product=hypothetical protein / location=Cvel_scaffold1954:5241-6068(-) / protein_length=276 / sequence_SO=supercontig / SO=protein_coding / is_pseudo=false